MTRKTVLVCALLAGCAGDDLDKDFTITPLYPAEGWELTDVGVSFSWNRPNHYERDKSERWTTHKFQVQVAHDGDFSDLALNETRWAVGHDTAGFDPHESYDSTTLNHWRETMWMPPEMLEPGSYSWRVRVKDDEGGPWTEPIAFEVNDDHSREPLIRPLSPENPLFSFDMYDLDGGGWGEDPRELLADVWESIPADIQDNVALAVPHEYWGKDPSIDGLEITFEELVEPLNERDVPTMFKVGGPDGDFQWFMPLALIERLYQENPNCLGVVTGENTWAYVRAWDEPEVHKQELLWLQRVVELSAKYGRYVVMGEGSYDFLMEKFLGEENPEDSEIDGDFEWMSPDFIRDHKDTIIWAPKNNIMWSQHHADSIVFGAWLAGMTTHLGLWSEAWYWSDAGFTEVFSETYQTDYDADFSHMPYALWSQMQLMSASKGASFFHFGGESGVINDSAEYHPETDSMVSFDEGEMYPEDVPVSGMWDMYGHVMPAFERYIAPLIRALVHEQLIPSKDEVMEQVQVAIRPGPVETPKGSFTCYGEYAPLYLATYGIENWVDVPDDVYDNEYLEDNPPPTGCRYDLFPASGRYYWLPILPHPIESIPGADVAIFERTELDSWRSVRDALDPLYPERATGSAHVIEVGGRVFITNSHENTNIVQDFDVPLSAGLAQNLAGEVQPHAYVLVRNDDERVFVHANANHNGPYTDGRQTDLRVRLDAEPTVVVTPASAASSRSWDAASSTLSLTVEHSLGAVEIILAAQ
jgi:hypothetical protein